MNTEVNREPLDGLFEVLKSYAVKDVGVGVGVGVGVAAAAFSCGRNILPFFSLPGLLFFDFDFDFVLVQQITS